MSAIIQNKRTINVKKSDINTSLQALVTSIAPKLSKRKASKIFGIN